MRDSVDMHDDDFDPDSFEELEGPSKSQRKRDATALQDLGAQLVKLTSAQLNRIPLPDDLLAAVRAAQAMPQRGAHKRQLQYIGKLMRQINDPEPIRAALATVQNVRR